MSRLPVDYTSNLEVTLRHSADLGEGPFWDDETGTLVFVDSNRGRIHRFNPIEHKLTTIEVGRTIGVAIPRRSGGFVASSVDGLLSISEPGGKVGMLLDIEKDLPNNRMNDGKCDSWGRLWTGTLSIHFERNAGSLYRIDPDMRLTRAVENIRVSNGLAWSPDEKLFYYNDTLSRGVDLFDYDIESGTLSHRRRFVEISREEGLPDGMTVDAEGCVWVALYYGGEVRRYSPSGEWIGRISMPVTRVTSCVFGGPGLDELYITTADIRMHDDGRPHETEAGFLFRCRTGVTGLPSHKFAG